MGQDLVIVGAGEFAQIAFEYFAHDSDYTVVAFAIDTEYLSDESRVLCGVPVIAIEDMTSLFSPHDHQAFVAIPATSLNSPRMEMCERIRSAGYVLASYVSSHAFVWHNVPIGENTFIFENNVIQPFASIGSGCILWSGNHVGHRATIEDGVFVASHAVISGYCRIGSRSFWGVNCTIIDGVAVAPETVVGAGALVVRPTESRKVYGGIPARALPGTDARDVAF